MSVGGVGASASQSLETVPFRGRTVPQAVGTPSRGSHPPAHREPIPGHQGALTMNTVTLTKPAALDLQPIIEEFFREGCVLVPGVLSADDVAAVRAKTDALAADPNTPKRHISYVGDTFVLRYCHEADSLFAELAER